MTVQQQILESKTMQRYSQLAGALHMPSLQPGKPEVIRYVRSNIDDRLLFRVWTRLIAYGSLVLVFIVTTIMFLPAHWVALRSKNSPVVLENWAMLICLFLLQLFLLLGTYMAARATLRAKNPIPLTPPAGLRVALVTTRAPGEPTSLVRNTLKAALKVHYAQGSVDVWLLDETRSRALRKTCKELGVSYFSRRHVSEWNIQPAVSRRPKNISDITRATDQRFATRTKHGNLNAWGEFMEDYHYDIIAGIDTDQVPLPNFLERLLGYFHDPDVAYVVGPQVYGNAGPGLKHLVTRWAESQASFFQSTIQRAANSSGHSMFVGTNYAVRARTLDQIGGYYPCITEDLATGLSVHSTRNPTTGNNWKSVYTPDVLALGEGPQSWGSYFNQQWRWAAGAFDTILHCAPDTFRGLQRSARIHYGLILLFYPLAAFTWLLGVTSSIIYLLSGASAISVAWNQFISLNIMSAVLQLGIYFWNRRSDVSPMTRPGSYGIPGMVITSLCAPVYFSAFIGTLLRRKPVFVVTRKGSSAEKDSFKAFAIHLRWGALLTVALLTGCAEGHTSGPMLAWVGLQLGVCFMPVVLGLQWATMASKAKSFFRVRLRPRLLTVRVNNA